jgi:hypothetical protein
MKPAMIIAAWLACTPAMAQVDPMPFEVIRIDPNGCEHFRNGSTVCHNVIDRPPLAFMCSSEAGSKGIIPRCEDTVAAQKLKKLAAECKAADEVLDNSLREIGLIADGKRESSPASAVWEQFRNALTARLKLNCGATP